MGGGPEGRTVLLFHKRGAGVLWALVELILAFVTSKRVIMLPLNGRLQKLFEEKRGQGLR